MFAKRHKKSMEKPYKLSYSLQDLRHKLNSKNTLKYKHYNKENDDNLDNIENLNGKIFFIFLQISFNQNNIMQLVSVKFY